MRDPFRIEGPAVISFSGGRTSGYMLWRILQAHGGGLPDDVRVLFANTGKEMPETLNFVQECSERWKVLITWLEFSPDPVANKRYKVVDYKSANRTGEPFKQLVELYSLLPNPTMRYCTGKLKIIPQQSYCQQILGWDEWDSALGLRADEQRRVSKLNGGTAPQFITTFAPLATAGIVISDISQFWLAQPFDLQLPNMNGKTMHGNCDLCFLKPTSQIMSLIRENPNRAIWWMERESVNLHKEKPEMNFFRKDRPSYKTMYEAALNQVEMFKFDDEALEDCSCTD